MGTLANTFSMMAMSGIECRTRHGQVVVSNRGDRPVQVGSHYHFFEVNSALDFDRAPLMACAWISRRHGDPL